MRKMAHIEVIHSISTIDGADAIELACVLGWQCVVKKGEFRVGQLVVYCEIDSWVPLTTAPFLQKGEKIREFNGVPGNRLKTIKLRGALSQGLILPVTRELQTEWDIANLVYSSEDGNDTFDLKEGDDVSEILGIQKWEAPENPKLAGTQKGNFPAQFPKTDQERIQNISDRTWNIWQEKNYSFEVTEKLEGSSMTCYLLDGVFGVCSRNIDLKETPEGLVFKCIEDPSISFKAVSDEYLLKSKN